jgi:hypothetical protein
MFNGKPEHESLVTSLAKDGEVSTKAPSSDFHLSTPEGIFARAYGGDDNDFAKLREQRLQALRQTQIPLTPTPSPVEIPKPTFWDHLKFILGR